MSLHKRRNLNRFKTSFSSEEDIQSTHWIYVFGLLEFVFCQFKYQIHYMHRLFIISSTVCVVGIEVSKHQLKWNIPGLEISHF